MCDELINESIILVNTVHEVGTFRLKSTDPQPILTRGKPHHILYSVWYNKLFQFTAEYVDIFQLSWNFILLY